VAGESVAVGGPTGQSLFLNFSKACLFVGHNKLHLFAPLTK